LPADARDMALLDDDRQVVAWTSDFMYRSELDGRDLGTRIACSIYASNHANRGACPGTVCPAIFRLHVWRTVHPPNTTGCSTHARGAKQVLDIVSYLLTIVVVTVELVPCGKLSCTKRSHRVQKIPLSTISECDVIPACIETDPGIQSEDLKLLDATCQS
jgi:hypothetical protein